MNMTIVSANGQLTVPVEIRRLLKLNEGDKLLFIQKENGEVFCAIPRLMQFKKHNTL
jgi:AbrB family looped-hinge helix DNA binding protein